MNDMPKCPFCGSETKRIYGNYAYPAYQCLNCAVQRFDHFQDGVVWLMEKTIEYYPDSDFSKTWLDRKMMSEGQHE